MRTNSSAALVAQSGAMIPEPKYRVTLSMAFQWANRNNIDGPMVARYAREDAMRNLRARIEELIGQLKEPGFTFGDEPDLFGDESVGLAASVAETLVTRFVTHLLDGHHSDLDALASEFDDWLKTEVSL